MAGQASRKRDSMNFGRAFECADYNTQSPMAYIADRAYEKLSSALYALKHRNFKIFTGGPRVSVTGNYLQTAAPAWLVSRLTGSATFYR